MARRTVRVGTSGWVYGDWRGAFYPDELPARDRLAFYAERFDTVEINSTHYRLASAPAVAAWQACLPRGFHMVAKGSAFITHRLKLRNCEAAIERFFAPLAPLTSLRVVLWQLPARFPLDLERVDRFLAALPKRPNGRAIRHAMEFRDPWWWRDEVRDLLARHRVAFCAVSHPELPDAVVVTGDLVYARFHGLGPAKYHYDYSDAELVPWAARLRPHLGARDVYAFFNNDYEAHAIRNGERLREMLAVPASARPVREPTSARASRWAAERGGEGSATTSGRRDRAGSVARSPSPRKQVRAPPRARAGGSTRSPSPAARRARPR